MKNFHNVFTKKKKKKKKKKELEFGKLLCVSSLIKGNSKLQIMVHFFFFFFSDDKETTVN